MKCKNNCGQNTQYGNEYCEKCMDEMIEQEKRAIRGIKKALRLTIEMQGSKIVMIDDSKETVILDNREQAVSNFASWVYEGHLSGKPTCTCYRRE